ncbi:MAG: 2-hydroxyacyl-CoA dehydratase family protein, partial [Dehalococcoidia bacterium]
MNPVLEAAESKWLKAGAVYHCGNVKGLLGLLTTGLLPGPDLLITSGLLCETAPKTIDLLHEVYGLSTCTYDACCDRESKEYADATQRLVDMAAKSLRMVTARIKDEIGVEITDDMLRETMDARKGLNEAFGRIQGLIVSSDPMPLRSQDQFLLDYLSAFTFSVEHLPEVIDVLNMLYEELQERVDKGVGVTGKGAPKILAI